jgi:hypothetical protein
VLAANQVCHCIDTVLSSKAQACHDNIVPCQTTGFDAVAARKQGLGRSSWQPCECDNS